MKSYSLQQSTVNSSGLRWQYLTISIRRAVASDKEPVLRFCTNTFSWGDYIDQAWDAWFKDRKGRLFVADSDGKETVAVAHVALCPYKESAWIEGLRVRPDRRKAGIATAMVDAMVEFARQKDVSEALGIVGFRNNASQQLLEKSGFGDISTWEYLATDRPLPQQKADARLATVADMEDVNRYLQSSEVFGLSSGRYMNTWRWYRIDRRAIRLFIDRRRLLVTGKPITGIAILNMDGYWNHRDVLQVVYLDSTSPESLINLLAFASDLYMLGGFSRLHIICHQHLAPAVKRFHMVESEQFLLYRKDLQA